MRANSNGPVFLSLVRGRIFVMEEHRQSEDIALAHKIARLVEERGWNQEEFARITRLNRHTVRTILQQGRRAPDPEGASEEGPRRLRNATISSCARGLGISVNDLRTQPLDRLLPRMIEGHPANDASLRRLHDQATQPELRAWMDRNANRARELSDEEIDELLALQGASGALSAFGVEGFVQRIERRRKVVRQVYRIAGTEYLDLLEQVVGLIHDKVRPPGEAGEPER
jgi:hypothetical protein